MMEGMASDDPITIPPPEGEEDAYSAATRVGSIPSDLMAKFREQGLLPPSEPALPIAEATEEPATDGGEATLAAAPDEARAPDEPTADHGASAALAAPAATPATPAPIARASTPDRSWMFSAPVALAGGATLVILGTLAFVVAFWTFG